MDLQTARRLRLDSADGDSLLDSVMVCRSFAMRALGLMGRARMPGAWGAGLLFPRANALHTCCMRFSLDFFFLDERGQMLSVRREVRPWRMVSGPPGSRHSLEIPSDPATTDRLVAQQGRWVWGVASD